MGNKRLQKEYEELTELSASSDNYGVSAQIVGDQMTHWKGIIKGPSDTVYQGGTFYIDIVIPSEYPYKPPRMRFDTKIWHPNVSSQTGAICLDILGEEWSPTLTIRTALLSLQALMCSPVPEEPQDLAVGAQYKNNIADFNHTATLWTRNYARDPEIVYADKVRRLVELGFNEDEARSALEQAGWEDVFL